jgi:hypothetical protein
VAHGRDDQAHRALFDFLRAINLEPLEWEGLVAETHSAAPYSGEAVERGFAAAQAVIVLFTPDDVAQLHPDLGGDVAVLQPRPNVVLEAGMALATHPDRTLLVSIGHVALPSNLAGRNLVRLDGNPESLNAIATRLARAGCDVDKSGGGWLDTSPIAALSALQRRMNSQMLLMPSYVRDPPADAIEGKARATLAVIEEAAQDFLLPILESGEFERVVDDSHNHAQLVTIARELAALEGYLLLTDIGLPPYSRFIKGIDLFLRDDLGEALRTLRRGAHGSGPGELQRFSRYWVGHLNTVIGRYPEAVHMFEAVEGGLSAGSPERYELQCRVAQARFQDIGAAIPTASPPERIAAVSHLLITLADIAQSVQSVQMHDHLGAGSGTSQRVASTRADLLTWIAFDERRLAEPLQASAVDEARVTIERMRGGDGGTGSLEDAQGVRPWHEMREESVRAWALLQAREIYRSQPEPNDVLLVFGVAECEFALGQVRDLDRYIAVEQVAVEMLGKRRERRRSIEILQIILICKIRAISLSLPRSDEALTRQNLIEVRRAYRDLRGTLAELTDHEVTVFSYLQRCNLTQIAFKREVEMLLEQAS